MQIKNKLQAKSLISILSTLFIVFIIIGIFIGRSKKEFAVEKAKQYTQLLSNNGADRVKSLFNKHVTFVSASSSAFSNVLKTDNSQIIEIIEGQFGTLLKSDHYIDAGWVLLSSNVLGDISGGAWTLFEMKNEENSLLLEQLNTGDADQLYSQIGEADAASVSKLTNRANKRFVEIYAPLFNGSTKVGLIGIRLSMDALAEIVNGIEIIEGGSIAILTNSGIYASHSNSIYLGNQYAETFIKENNEFKVEENVAKGIPFEVDIEKNKQSYHTFFTPVKICKTSPAWSIEVVAPMNKLLAASKRNMLLAVLISFLGLLVIGFVAYKITQRIIKPVKQVTQILNFLSTGNLKDIKLIAINSSDELQEMGDKINNVVSGLKKTEDFALEIEEGNLNNDYDALSDDDQLGKALIKMRDSLKHNKEEDEKRKKEDEQAAWSTNGIAKFGEILRQDNDNMKNLGYNIISNLVKYLKVNQGALFVLSDDEDKDTCFELITTIAFDRDKHLTKEIRIGEGLVGRCAFERKTVFLTDVPKNYHNITSGMGDAQPGCILIVPCILNDAVFGIIELASFTELKPFEIEFVEKLGESIGSTLSSARINLKTASLLAASQNQSEELAAQEEELRQNLEEMEATQEDLKRQMQTNIEMREEMSKQNALLDALLDSLPDYIYFKDKDSKFLRLSKSMIHLFGTTSVTDIIGKSDFDFHTEVNAKQYFEDEQKIMLTQEGFTDKTQKEIKADGTPIWNSVSKLPLLTADGECFGTFGISKNITDIKYLELEAKKQTTLLDALLNSLPDYIYFKDEESRFLRISKSMIHLFGAESVEEIIGKSDFDFHSKENAQKYYADEKHIMESGSGITNQLQKEHMTDGTVIWNSVTKLPLLTDEGTCMGTFGISKDVTQLKNLEIESTKQRSELTGVIDAIKKATLTIEYDKKGVVIDANQGILDLLKVTKKNYIGTLNKDEIADMSSAEHKTFWDRLLNGESQAIKNTIKVGNKKHTLYEAYSPVFDENNKLLKILRLAFDIS
ncbi:MAG: PAS domain-containing protein [Salinivirgaceae bacterium]|jgi:methyl-accepting chemotaxis protein|nr:PAS domain-containing protein [Salinivirgaceae bacterium]